ncbi:MAG: hypothetical protein N3A38_07500 [Planctomycetota bacterium]|nr:hypothetical protein [Planctomycetota bacterium]
MSARRRGVESRRLVVMEARRVRVLGKMMEIAGMLLAMAAAAVGFGLTPDGRPSLAGESVIGLVALVLFAAGAWVASRDSE